MGTKEKAITVLKINWDYDRAMDAVDRVIKLGNAARASLVRKGIWEAATEGTQAQRDLASKRLGPLTKVAGSIRYNSGTGIVNGPVRDYECKPISEAAFMDIYGDLASWLLQQHMENIYSTFTDVFKNAKSVDFNTVVLPRVLESYHNFQAFCEERRVEKQGDKPVKTSRQEFEQQEEVSVY